MIYKIASLIMANAMIAGNFIQAQAAGSVYYVSPTGNDANPGTASAPFKTFAKANSLLTAVRTSINGSSVTFPFTGQPFSLIYKGSPSYRKWMFTSMAPWQLLSMKDMM